MMNQVDQNINKDMSDFDLIDVESLDLSDDQTWLYKHPEDTGEAIDIVDWGLSLDWPVFEDGEYVKTEKSLYGLLDSILKNQVLAMPDKHKFDSRTYVKPKKRVQRPSIQNIVEVPSNPPSITSPSPSLNPPNKYLTYNKYNSPLGPIMRLRTFNVDTDTENSNTIKEYAMKRRSIAQDDDPQLEDVDITLASDMSGRLSENTPTRPINIDLSQPAHNLHNTFNKGLSTIMSERGSLNMYQSGESLMRMSPPSLVSSLLMESSGNFNHESLDSRKSISQRDSGLPTSARDSIDPMMTSMTLSILDEKDMNTSFLSQTTYPDNDSLMDSLPPSLVNSVNSSYVMSNSGKPKDSVDSNIFSSATFTHLEQSERLLSARPRFSMYNSYSKRESGIKNSESYTKAREEACQIDTTKVLNESTDNKDSPKAVPRPSNDMAETITLHYSNNKFKRDNDAEKENLNASFEKDDRFYKEMGVHKPVDPGRNSLNITLDKQELNEIIQARQKLSLARKALPTEEKVPNQTDTSPAKTIQLPNQTITVPRKSIENASELLSRRRAMYSNSNGFDKDDRREDTPREPPKRNATFKKTSPKTSMDTTVVFVKSDDSDIIDINSATLNLIDTGDRTLQQEEWGSQERAMVGSSESTDTGTFSSSSPPESVPDTVPAHEPRAQIASTPLMSLRKGHNDLLNIHNTISPIYDMVDDKSYTLTKAPSVGTEMERTYDMNTTVINTATMVKRSSAKRDILAKNGPEKKSLTNLPQKPIVNQPLRRISPTSSGINGGMAPPTGLPRKTGLPTSKLRQYSSHKELRIPANAPQLPTAVPRAPVGRTMVRRNVYASNPALSPTAPTPPLRRDSYTVAVDPLMQDEEKPTRPVMTAPPALVRQGTETLRRERPQSQLVQPKDLRSAMAASAVPGMRSHMPAPTTRPYSIAGTSQLRVSRPITVPAPKTVSAIGHPVDMRPAAGMESRVSALPRPSRLPGPRRTGLRPPSVYSVAPAADADNY